MVQLQSAADLSFRADTVRLTTIVSSMHVICIYSFVL